MSEVKKLRLKLQSTDEPYIFRDKGADIDNLVIAVNKISEKLDEVIDKINEIEASNE
jgi:hypothetical protein